jgi:hypothetical protein
MRCLETYFAYTAAVILFLEAFAISLCAFEFSGILNQPDPLFLLNHRTVLIIVATLEIGLSIFLLTGKKHSVKIPLVTWLTFCFLFYRLGVRWIDGSNIFSCLGNVSDVLPIRPHILDLINSMLLGYLLLGGCALLILDCDLCKNKYGARKPDHLTTFEKSTHGR